MNRLLEISQLRESAAYYRSPSAVASYQIRRRALKNGGRQRPCGAGNFLRSGPKRAQLWTVSSAASSSEAGLRGRLEQFGLATVLTFLDLERRSGELVVVAGERVGRLWLRRGRVLRARLEGSRRASKSVVYDLLTLGRGRFSFTQMELEEIADEVNAPTTLLLMEAARRADEATVSAP
jgi:hypothetical protein